LDRAVHPGRALYSILRYWRSVGLHQLELPPVVEDEEDAIQQQASSQVQLAELAKNCSTCQACALHLGRSQSIFGRGPHRAPIMLIGASPSSLEEQAGAPFQGEEGKLLDRMLEKMGYQREQLYLTYATPCRPPEDRTPTWDELLTCRHWLLEQIELVEPKCIITLGTTATQCLLERQLSIAHLRGQWQKHKHIPVMPTYHPRYLLKKTSARKDVWSDMLAVLENLKTRN
jgi:uracil-DNA glycosylase